MQKAAILTEVAQVYPNAQVLSGPTNYYNCHSYAYHLTEGWSNQVWINHYDNSYVPNSNIQKYWNDCYQVTSNPAAAVKIYYTGDHSAVASVNGKYDSKWGAYPLMRHDPHDAPAIYQPYSRVYYQRPISVTISGPDNLYSGQVGNYTAILTNGTGSETYSWEIQEQYTNGQISSWMPLYGGIPNTRSVLMPSSLRSFTLKVIAANSTHTAENTLRVGNNDNGAFRLASGLTAAPNPFSGTTLISYTLANDARIVAEIYSADRRQMAVLANGAFRAGRYEHRVDASRWTNGTYTMELTITEGNNPPRRESLTLVVSR